ncbi:MAG: hypothetical protein LBF97_08365 [Elusimicrobiota bacterium]|jgi:hypothetical protein|nr:hypothetical protein [Elusimicrobiota bacterium]
MFKKNVNFKISFLVLIFFVFSLSLTFSADGDFDFQFGTFLDSSAQGQNSSNEMSKEEKKLEKEIKKEGKKYNDIVDMRSVRRVNQNQNIKFDKVYIYKDVNYTKNNYIPSGFMGDYGDLKLTMRNYVKPYKGISCLKISYSAAHSQGAGWAGIYWQEPLNNWGTEDKGLNLTGAKRLVFFIKGEKGGEVIDKIKVGGIKGEFSDSADVDFGPIILKKSWKKYIVDLQGHDMSYIIGGFCFVVTSESNPEGIVFYLDEIYFE